jgi:hypothetical protein
MERRWLFLAHSYEFTESLENFSKWYGARLNESVADVRGPKKNMDG